MDLRIATCRSLPEPDPDEELLLAALARHGMRARMAAWHDPAEDWARAVQAERGWTITPARCAISRVRVSNVSRASFTVAA